MKYKVGDLLKEKNTGRLWLVQGMTEHRITLFCNLSSQTWVDQISYVERYMNLEKINQGLVMEKKFEIGDLVEYKNKLYLVADREYSPFDDDDGERLYTYLYRFHDLPDRQVMDMFVEKVQ